MFEPYSNIIFNNKVGDNEYLTYKLTYLANEQDYLEYIIPILREEYGFGLNVDEKLPNFSTDEKDKLREILAKYNTPNPNKKVSNRGSQLDNTRGKIGEVVAKDILIKKDGVEFSGRISLEEEDPDMPKKGIDNFGFIFKESNEEIVLEKVVVCEVKASSSKSTPPAVVETNKDSLYKELVKLKDFNDRMMKAITKAFDRFNTNKYCAVIAELLLAIEESDDLSTFQSKVMVVPFLLRTEDTYSDKDFGKFITDTSEFANTTIKYYIVCIDLPLEEFADNIYKALRKEG